MNKEQDFQAEKTGLKPLELARMQALSRLDVALQSSQESVLREHQISMVAALHAFLESGETAGHMSEPTGVGKSAVMVRTAELLGLKTVILSPTQQILEQTHREAKKFAPSLNITSYYQKEHDLSGTAINTTYQSMSEILNNRKGGGRRKGKETEGFNPEDIGLLLCDEVDLALGEARHTIFREFPNAIKIGMTATPYFGALEGYKRRGIVDEEEEWTGLFTNLIHEMTLEEAIEREILTHLDVHLLKTDTVVSDIQVLSNGEYRESDVKRHFDQLSRNALAIAMVAGVDHLPHGVNLSDAQKQEIKNIHEKIKGKRTVIFAIDIDHAERLTKQLKEQGIAVEAVHSKMDQRVETLMAHKQGDTPVVVGVDILGRGWDSPETEVGIFLRPTYSGIVAGQQLGRILRQSEETGKTKAIAIQLVDQFTQRRNAPVLIPDIFDPEYVLRGTQTGFGPSGSSIKISEPREKPIVTFSGMNIEFVVEEAKSRELLKTRFIQGSLEESTKFFRKLVEDIKADNPEMGTYELFKTIAAQLPQRIPFKAQEKTLEAIASIDENTRRLGQETFLFLNMKTLLTVVNSYFIEEIDGQEDCDEMIHAATVSVLEKLSNLRPNLAISQQVHNAATNGVAEYLGKRDNMPAAWIKEVGDRQLISEKIKEALAEDVEKLTDERIDNLSEEVSREIGVSQERLRDYLIYIRLINRRDKGVLILEDSTASEAVGNQLKRNMEEVLETITYREKRVLELRYGLEDGRERNLEEVGREFGVTRERIRQIEAKALRKLRHPTRSRRLHDYRDEDPGQIGYIKHTPERRREVRPQSVFVDPSSVERFFLKES